MTDWSGLTPPYTTIVADPPWDLAAVNAGWAGTSNARLRYSLMSLDEVKALTVAELAAPSAHLYLWTVTSVLRHSFDVVEAWGFKPKQVLVWCKPGLGSGARFRQNVEYVIFGTRGAGLPITRRDVGAWHEWPRAGHSVKPSAFGDLVESVSPGPYVELFARAPRLGWDSWGHGYETGAT
jgi:N6-adenosine-specific RNA methylase IME4